MAKSKFSSVFFPFLAMFLCFIVGYTGLQWVLLIKWRVINVSDYIINYSLPGLIALILVLTRYRKYIRLIIVDGLDRWNSQILFGTLVWIALVVSTVLAQFYVSSATMQIVKLGNITQIKDTKPVACYSLDSFYIDNPHSLFHKSSTVWGKNNEERTLHLHVISPIYKSADDTLNGVQLAWLATNYSTLIDNTEYALIKDSCWKVFIQQTMFAYGINLQPKFAYLKRTSNDDDGRKYIAALTDTNYKNASGAIILEPVQEPFGDRNGLMLLWFLVSFVVGSFSILVLVYYSEFDNPELQPTIDPGFSGVGEVLNNDFLSTVTAIRNEEGNNTNGNKALDIENWDAKTVLKKLFIPGGNFFITSIILDLNVLVFLMMVFCGLGFLTFQTSDLYKWGGNYNVAYMNGEHWRTITSMFIHAGIAHLACNMVSLVIFGFFTEIALGRVRFIAVYLLSGFLASIFSICWNESAVSVGASGAIFGLFGSCLALLLTKRFPQELRKIIFYLTLFFSGFSLLYGFAPGVDNAAHIGGLVMGFVVGLAFCPFVKRKDVLMFNV